MSAWGGGELSLQAASTATVTDVELVLQPSVVDAALSNVRELLTTPYGCLEQLVSTTVPNVALYQTLKKVDALDKLDPESQSLLAEARSRAVQGTSAHPRPGGEGRRLHLVRWLQHARRGDDPHCPGRPGLRGGRGPGGRQ